MFQSALQKSAPPALVRAKGAGGGEGEGGGVVVGFRDSGVCVSTHQKTISMSYDELVSET